MPRHCGGVGLKRGREAGGAGRNGQGRGHGRMVVGVSEGARGTESCGWAEAQEGMGMGRCNTDKAPGLRPPGPDPKP